jgi:hypothetical protein
MAFYNLKLREQYLRHCAGQLDWKFSPDGDKTMLKWLLDFKLFKTGGRKRIRPLIIREFDDLSFTALFDYEYTISTGKSSYTYRQTVYFRYSKQIALPYFIMVPEKWYHRIGTYFGMQDIDFTEYPVFSKNYLLQGADEYYIRHHFDHAEMVRFFDRNKKYSLEGVNYLMVLYQHNVVLKEKEMLKLVEIGNRLHNYFTEKTPGIELPAE